MLSLLQFKVFLFSLIVINVCVIILIEKITRWHGFNVCTCLHLDTTLSVLVLYNIKIYSKSLIENKNTTFLVSLLFFNGKFFSSKVNSYDTARICILMGKENWPWKSSFHSCSTLLLEWFFFVKTIILMDQFHS